MGVTLARDFSVEIKNFLHAYAMRAQTLSSMSGLSPDCVGQILRRRHTDTGVNRPTVEKIRSAMYKHAESNHVVNNNLMRFRKAKLEPSDGLPKISEPQPQPKSDLLRDALSMLSKEQLCELLLKSN